MKIFPYIFFIALGVLFAEVLSFNYSFAIIEIWGYLTYGLIYILAIDFLFRRKIKYWKIVYLLGILVGFITEAYMAKVVFFGWNAESAIIAGFAPFETTFLSFAFHPIFSFLIPVAIAQKYFSFPFAMKPLSNKILIPLILVYPLITGATYGLGRDIIFPMIITIGILVIWTLFLKFAGKTKNLQLNKTIRILVLISLIGFTIFTFFNMPTFGKEEVLIPEMLPLLISFLFPILILFVIHKKTKDLKFQKTTEYIPKFNLLKVLLVGIIYLLLETFILILTGNLFAIGFLVLYVAGLILGPLYFLYVLFSKTKT